MDLLKCKQCHSNLKLNEVIEFKKDDVVFLQKHYSCINHKCKHRDVLQKVTINNKDTSPEKGVLK